MRTRVKLIAAAIAATLPAVVGVQAAVSVPAGFEELARGQNMMLDVSLYGESLGVFQARVDLENVQFLQPEALAAAVLKKSADAPGLETLLRRSLSSPLKRNGNLACGTNGAAPGCDYIETDSVAVIYDENNARAGLFLGGQYRPSKRRKTSTTMPARRAKMRWCTSRTSTLLPTGTISLPPCRAMVRSA
ncbi:hypothetical protein VRB23_20580 [Erwinia aphidicola]|uniref:hypothetical protein n=1 Tax=Erwinia aphidicola TaxID=68334 RepID=UPI0030D59E5E